MLNRERLFLLTGRSTSRHQTVYHGISLTEERNGLADEEMWQAWLLGQYPQPVCVSTHQVSIVHYTGAGGSGWMVDGKQAGRSPDDPPYTKFHPHDVGPLKFSPPTELALPVFVSSSQNLQPCLDEVVIRLSISTYFQVPDLKADHEFTAQALAASHASMASLMPKELRAKLEDYKNPAMLEREQELASTPIGPGAILPVRIVPGPATLQTTGVLLLNEPAGDGTFRCRLYRADGCASIAMGQTLYRRAIRETSRNSKAISAEARIGQIVSVTSTSPIPEEAEGRWVVRRFRDGEVLPIECASCKQQFDPTAFTSAQHQLMDLWGSYYPLLRKKSLLERAVCLLNRYPELKKLEPALRSFWNDASESPRQTPHQRRQAASELLEKVTTNDLELRDYLYRTTCDYAKVLEKTTHAAAKYDQFIGGRLVLCPACGDGPVLLKHSRPG